MLPPPERQRGRVAEAHLVEDATGLLVAPRVDVLALEAGQGLQDAERQVGVDEQRHPRRDERVATEDRHEPRRPRRQHHPLGVVGVEDPERSEVLGARGDHGPQSVVVGLDLGHLAAPLGQALGGGGPVDRLAAQVAGVDGLPFDDRVEFEAPRPLPVGGDDGLEADEVVGHDRRRREQVDDEAAVDRAPPVGEFELTVAIARARSPRRTCRLGLP